VGLFKVPKRNNISTQKILDLVENEEVSKPKITLRGTSLSAKIQAIGETVERNLGAEKDNYLLIQTKEEWLEYCRQAVDDGIVALDTESTSLNNILGDIVGMSLQSPSQKAMYIPIGHISTITEQLLPNQIKKEDVKEGLEIIKNCKEIYMHNAYFDRVLLYQQFGIWVPCTFDSLIAANLLNENEPHGLKALHNKYCEHGDGSGHKFAELFGSEIPFCYIPYNIGYIYAARDALLTLDLVNFQKPFLTVGKPQCTKYGLERISDIFWNTEMPILDVVCDMKVRGIKFDFKRAEELKEKYTKLRDRAKKEFDKSLEPVEKEIKSRQKMYNDIDYPVNYNSPSQIKIILYDILKIKSLVKKSPQGTGKAVLDAILESNEYKDSLVGNIAKALGEVKKYDKLIGTFIDKLTKEAVLHHGKIHANFNQCGTSTMRFSSSNPKQNWAMAA